MRPDCPPAISVTTWKRFTASGFRPTRWLADDVYIIEKVISRVTDAVLEEVSDWQNRALEPVYPIVFLDALRVKIRDAESRQVKNKAVYVALGVTPEGEREVLLPES
jgi:transposase-like protein